MKNNIQTGSGIFADVLTLSVPIGLAVASNKLINKGQAKNETKDEQDGGFLGTNLLQELGISVVPFALLGTLDYWPSKNDKKTKKDSIQKDKN